MKSMPNRGCAPFFILMLIVTFVYYSDKLGHRTEALVISAASLVMLSAYLWSIYHISKELKESREIYNAVWVAPVRSMGYIKDIVSVVAPTTEQNTEYRLWKPGWNLERFHNEVMELERHGIESGEIERYMQEIYGIEYTIVPPR